MASRHLSAAICVTLLIFTTHAKGADSDVIDIGSRRELFVDRFLIDRIEGAQLVLHEPRPAETVIEIDRPWEGPFSFGVAVWKDGDTFRMYYRGWHANKVPAWCIAESADGIHWTKPDFGLVEVDDSRENNVVGTVDEKPLANLTGVFLNSRPEAPASDKYIGIAATRPSQSELRVHLWLSPDGVQWRELQDEPVFITDLFNAFDSTPSLFWSEAERQYVLYFRYSIRGKPRGPDIIPGVRTVARTTSADLVHWSEPTPMEYGDDGPQPPENLYTNSTHPYFRAPHIYVAFPARFMPGRRSISDAQLPSLDMATFGTNRYHLDCADSVFMTTRGGNTYDRSFMGVFIRPGLGPANWGSRSNYALRGVVQTGPAEMSLYVNRHYAQATWHIQRMALRLDGFASVSAPYEGGELLTKPLTFHGRHLILNYATSAAGSARVEIQDAEGTPIPGFALSECCEIFGDHIERAVTWKGAADLGALAGEPVRLRIVMKDADLYSLRFQSEAPKRVAYQRVDPLVLPADPALDFPGGQMTVEAFVYVVRPPFGHAWERILSKYNHVGGHHRRGWEWIMLHDGRFQFRVNQAEPGEKGVRGDRTLNSRRPLPSEQWVHIATVFDRPNRRMRLFVDGKLEAERKIPELPMRNTPDQDLFLGTYGDGSVSSEFYGKLDELRLTAAALEFDAPPVTPYTGGEPDTVALYHFDQLADGATIPNDAAATPLQARMSVPNADRLGESMPGFGRALRMNVR